MDARDFEIVWLTSWPPEKIRTLLRVVSCEKFLLDFPDAPVHCADWKQCASKPEWISQAVTKLNDRGWFWIDDDVSTYKKEIEVLKLPKARCLEVSKQGTRALEEVREALEMLRCT